MIVATMTDAEIAKELLADMDRVCAKSMHIIRERIKMMKKKRGAPMQYAQLYTAPSKNRWIVLMDMKNFKTQGSVDAFFICYWYDDYGIRVAKVGVKQAKYKFQAEMYDIEMYNTHFFKRYRERMCINPSVEALDVVLAYFYKNTFIPGPRSWYGENRFFGNVSEGIVLGTTGGVYDVYKTFLTVDMLRGDQPKLKELLDSISGIVADNYEGMLNKARLIDEKKTEIDRLFARVKSMEKLDRDTGIGYDERTEDVQQAS